MGVSSIDEVNAGQERQGSGQPQGAAAAIAQQTEICFGNLVKMRTKTCVEVLETSLLGILSYTKLLGAPGLTTRSNVRY